MTDIFISKKNKKKNKKNKPGVQHRPVVLSSSSSPFRHAVVILPSSLPPRRRRRRGGEREGEGTGVVVVQTTGCHMLRFGGGYGSLGILSSGDCRVNFLAIFPSQTGRGCTVLSTLTRAHTDDWRENKRAVSKIGKGVLEKSVMIDRENGSRMRRSMRFYVERGDGVFLERFLRIKVRDGEREAVTLINARIANVSDRCDLDHVPDGESNGW